MGHMSPRLKARRGRFGPAGYPPVVTITSPADGATFVAAGSPVNTASVNLTGTAFDDLGSPQDISSSIVWTSDIQAGSPVSLGTGDSITVELIIGTHVITASATDNTGSPQKTGTDSITITVT